MFLNEDISSNGVFAIDCEMVYTRLGVELARVTVIDANEDVVYDKLVKPSSEVLDYNTRYSGITKELLNPIKTTLLDVQTHLTQNLLSKDTILLGHSLDSDLLSLKLIHKKIVDTSIVFPHKRGLPYRRKLKNLMSDILKLAIQEGTSGHDAAEDACSCVKLMKWKVMEDGKLSKS